MNSPNTSTAILMSGVSAFAFGVWQDSPTAGVAALFALLVVTVLIYVIEVK